jgi:hypothetical protein
MFQERRMYISCYLFELTTCMKEIVMFIAYKVAQDLVNEKRGKFGQFERAKAFIAVLFTLTILSVGLIVNSIFFHKKLTITGEVYVLFITAPLILSIGFNFVFTKSVLARSIRLYKDSNFNEYGRAIGLLAMLLNLAIISILFYQSTLY